MRQQSDRRDGENERENVSLIFLVNPSLWISFPSVHFDARAEAPFFSCCLLFFFLFLTRNCGDWLHWVRTRQKIAASMVDPFADSRREAQRTRWSTTFDFASSDEKRRNLLFCYRFHDDASNQTEGRIREDARMSGEGACHWQCQFDINGTRQAEWIRFFLIF